MIEAIAPFFDLNVHRFSLGARLILTQARKYASDSETWGTNIGPIHVARALQQIHKEGTFPRSGKELYDSLTSGSCVFIQKVLTATKGRTIEILDLLQALKQLSLENGINEGLPKLLERYGIDINELLNEFPEVQKN